MPFRYFSIWGLCWESKNQFFKMPSPRFLFMFVIKHKLVCILHVVPCSLNSFLRIGFPAVCHSAQSPGFPPRFISSQYFLPGIGSWSYLLIFFSAPTCHQLSQSALLSLERCTLWKKPSHSHLKHDHVRPMVYLVSPCRPYFTNDCLLQKCTKSTWRLTFFLWASCSSFYFSPYSIVSLSPR